MEQHHLVSRCGIAPKEEKVEEDAFMQQERILNHACDTLMNNILKDWTLISINTLKNKYVVTYTHSHKKPKQTHIHFTYLKY